eukprot:4617710-Amphidinium_carterae.1
MLSQTRCCGIEAEKHETTSWSTILSLSTKLMEAAGMLRPSSQGKSLGAKKNCWILQLLPLGGEPGKGALVAPTTSSGHDTRKTVASGTHNAWPWDCSGLFTIPRISKSCSSPKKPNTNTANVAQWKNTLRGVLKELQRFAVVTSAVEQQQQQRQRQRQRQRQQQLQLQLYNYNYNYTTMTTTIQQLRLYNYNYNYTTTTTTIQLRRLAMSRK